MLHGATITFRGRIVNQTRGSPCREAAQFNVTIDGTPGTSEVRACDRDDVHREKDYFSISLSNGYFAGGDLGDGQPGGGTIQIPKCPPGWQSINCSTTPGDPYRSP